MFKFAFCTFGFSIGGLSLFSPFMVAFLRQQPISYSLLALILLLPNLVKIITEAPLGMIADMFGIKKVFLIGRIFGIISLLFLWRDSISTTMIVLSGIAHGIALSCMHNKIDAYIYNKALALYSQNYFNIMLSAYQIFISFSMFLIGSIAVMLFKIGSYKILIQASIVVHIVSLIIWPFMDEISFNSHKKKPTVSSLLTKIALNIKERPAIIFIIFLSATQFLLLYHGLATFKIFLLDQKFEVSALASLVSYQRLFIGASSIISLIFAIVIKKKLPLKILIVCGSSACCLVFIVLLINSHYLPYALGLVALVAPFIHVNIERSLEDYVSNEVRITISSLIGVFSSIFYIVTTIIFGLLSEIISSKSSIIIVMSLTSFLIPLISIIGIFACSNKQSSKNSLP